MAVSRPLPIMKASQGLTRHSVWAAILCEVAVFASFLEEQQKRLAARIVVIAGHVHNSERQEYGGITYLVTGGGGAQPTPSNVSRTTFSKVVTSITTT
jgi:hypothetical protein